MMIAKKLLKKEVQKIGIFVGLMLFLLGLMVAFSPKAQGSEDLEIYFDAMSYHSDHGTKYNEQNDLKGIAYDGWTYQSFTNSFGQEAYFIGREIKYNFHFSGVWTHRGIFGYVIGALHGYGPDHLKGLIDIYQDHKLMVAPLIGYEFDLGYIDDQDWTIETNVMMLPAGKGGTFSGLVAVFRVNVGVYF